MSLELILKLNNQAVSDHGSTIRILNGYPILNWELNVADKVSIDPDSGVITDVDVIFQNSYNIEISTSDYKIGTSEFVGDIVRTGIAISQNLFWGYSGTPIERGNIYYGQISIIDEFDKSSSISTFSFLYNSLPVVSNVEILPSQPSVTDTLQLDYDFFDADEDIESGTVIRWFKNGSYQRQFDNATSIAPTFLQNGDLWNVDVYPSDGFEFGARVTSSQVKVASTTVVVSDINILPSIPNIDDILEANYVVSDEFENDNVQIRWYVNNLILQELNDQKFVKPSLQEDDEVRFEIKHEESAAYVSSSTVTIVSSDFIVTNISIDGKIEPLDVSTITPNVKWKRFVPSGKSVNYISIKIGTFYESSNIYSTILTGDRNTFSIPPNTLEKGRDYYIGIAISDTQVFGDHALSHFRVRGSRWEEDVSNSIGWTFETLFVVKTEDSTDYQTIRINDGSKFAEIRLYNNKISLISGSIIEHLVATTTNNFLTVVGKGDDIMIYLNRELIINGEGILTQISNIKRLELGDDSSSSFLVHYKYFFYTTSGYFLPGVSSEYTNLQFHKYIEFKNNEIISLQSYINGKYIFGLNPDNTNDSSTIYAIKPGNIQKTITVPRTYSPINRISKSPDGKVTVAAHAKGATIITGYLINPFNHEMIFVDDDGVLNETFPTASGWELVENINRNEDDDPVAYFDSEGFHIDTL